MGGSSSKAISEQKADVEIAQIYKGTCDVTCQNLQENITIDLIGTTLGGGITFSQSCSTNANCIFGNTMDATADVLFKATNSSNAKNAWSGWSLNPFEFDNAESKSRQQIRESITESVTQDCKVSSYNQMNNISIFAVNSELGGGIDFDQEGNSYGKCTLDNTMSAAAYATGMAQNTATSGKDKKASKFGDKSTLFRIFAYAGIGLVVLIITIIVAKLITSYMGRKRAPQVATQRVPRVQCPEGTQLMINPESRRYSCVPRPRRRPQIPRPQRGRMLPQTGMIRRGGVVASEE